MRTRYYWKPFVVGALPLTFACAASVQAQTASPTPESTLSGGDSITTTTTSSTEAVPLTATINGASIRSTPVEASAGIADARNLAALRVQPITLIDAIAQAIENNPQRDAAQAALRAAQARIGIARSQGRPQVGLTGNQNLEREFGRDQQSSFDGGSGGGFGGGSNNSSQQEFLGFESSQSIGINADVPIYTGGRVSANRRAAQANARAQAAQTLQITQDLARTTIETYLNILRSEQLLTVAEGNLEVSRERSRIANVRFAAGAAARLEVLQADANLADAAQRRVNASTAVAQFRSALNILMARKPETSIRIVPISTLTPRIPIPSVPNAPVPTDDLTTAPGQTAPLSATVVSIENPSNDPLYAIAIANRPTGEVLRQQIEAAEANVDVARAQRRPSLGLSLGGLLRNPTNFLGRFALSIGLSFAQSLFSGGRISSQVAEARALEEQARRNYDNIQLQVSNQIENAVLTLDAAQKNAQLAEVGVVAAQEALRAAQLGYEAGVRTSLEVSDAQAALLTAQQQAINARFDVANAQSNLSAAVGVLTAEGQQAFELALQRETAAAKEKKK